GSTRLASVLFRSSAGAVIGTLWPVFDNEAAYLGRFFFGLALAGLSTGAALQTAKQLTLEHWKGDLEEAPSALAYVLVGSPIDIPFLETYSGSVSSNRIVELLTNQN